MKPDKKPIVSVKNENDQEVAFRVGCDLCVCVRFDRLAHQLYTALLIGPNEGDELRFTKKSVSEVAVMIEQAEREALERMKKND